MMTPFWIAFLAVLVLGLIGTIFLSSAEPFEAAVTLALLMGLAKFILSM